MCTCRPLFYRRSATACLVCLGLALSQAGAKTPPASVVGHVLTAASSTGSLGIAMYATQCLDRQRAPATGRVVEPGGSRARTVIVTMDLPRKHHALGRVQRGVGKKSYGLRRVPNRLPASDAGSYLDRWTGRDKHLCEMRRINGKIVPKCRCGLAVQWRHVRLAPKERQRSKQAATPPLTTAKPTR